MYNEELSKITKRLEEIHHALLLAVVEDDSDLLKKLETEKEVLEKSYEETTKPLREEAQRKQEQKEKEEEEMKRLNKINSDFSFCNYQFLNL